VIPLKPVNPLVRQLVTVGLAGAGWATVVLFLGPWFPAVVQPYNWWLFNLGLSVSLVCLVTALAIGADVFKREKGDPPTA